MIKPTGAENVGKIPQFLMLKTPIFIKMVNSLLMVFQVNHSTAIFYAHNTHKFPTVTHMNAEDSGD